MQTLTPEQLIKKAIVQQIMKFDRGDYGQQPIETAEQIEAAYDLAVERGLHWDWENEFREGEFETEIPCASSRHYESKSVATKIGNEYVGWTYWYGGGKFGEPEAIDWMEDSYFLDCKEEQVTITQRTFTKK